MRRFVVLPMVLLLTAVPAEARRRTTTTTTTTVAGSTTTTIPSSVAKPLVEYTGSGLPVSRWATGLRQDQPFDGVVIGGNADDNPWRCVAATADTSTRQALTAGQAVQGRYTKNLLHVWTLPGIVFSWGNQACVDSLVASFTELADTAKVGGLGLMVDTETYGQPSPWTTASAATWTTIGQALAARGVGITFTLGRSGYDSDRSFYAAMPGIIDALVASGASVGDGNLYAYWYNPGSYATAFSRLHSEQPGMKVNQPAATDYSPDLTGSVRQALQNSDQFAWLYTESITGRSWWDGSMPASIANAVWAGRG